MSSGAKSLVIYLPTLESGGAERLHIHLAPAFVAAGFNVTFLLHRAVGAWLSAVPAGVRVVSLERSRTLSCLMPLVRFLKSEQPDLLIANLGHNNILALWAACLAGVSTRIIASQHSVLSAESTGITSWQHRALPFLYRLFLGRAHGIVSVSKGVADDLAAVSGVARSRITVIYNPVVFNDFNQRKAEPVHHPWLTQKDIPVIISAGRLVHTKDFTTLLSAFAIVLTQRDARLIILGEGPMHSELIALTESLGIADKVSFPGFNSNPLPLMRESSLLVMSSRYEGFGNVLVEALACGTPVISTDCPYGPAEILDHGKFGTLVPVGNPPVMAKAILVALDQTAPRHVLQARGHEFTVEKAANEYIALFNRL